MMDSMSLLGFSIEHIVDEEGLLHTSIKRINLDFRNLAFESIDAGGQRHERGQ